MCRPRPAAAERAGRARGGRTGTRPSAVRTAHVPGPVATTSAVRRWAACRHGHVVHRDVEKLAARAEQRGGDRGGGVRAGQRVGDRVADRVRDVVAVGDQPGRGGHVVAVAGPLRVLAGPAVPGQAGPDGPGRHVLLRVEAQLPQGPGPGRFEDHVGPGEQAAQGREVVRRAEVERHREVPGVQQVEERRGARPGPVRPGPALHLHHRRAGQAEQVRAQRPGPQRGQVDDQRCVAPRRAPAARRASTAPAAAGTADRTGRDRSRGESEQPGLGDDRAELTPG